MTPHIHPIPTTWPKPNPENHDALVSRVTPDDLSDLYNRRVTTRALAKKYEVSEKWMSFLYPGKRPLADKKVKVKAKSAFREFHAKRVLRREVTTLQAAEAALVSYSTMRRIVLKLGQTPQSTPTP